MRIKSWNKLENRSDLLKKQRLIIVYIVDNQQLMWFQTTCKYECQQGLQVSKNLLLCLWKIWGFPAVPMPTVQQQQQSQAHWSGNNDHLSICHALSGYF